MHRPLWREAHRGPVHLFLLVICNWGANLCVIARAEHAIQEVIM